MRRAERYHHTRRRIVAPLRHRACVICRERRARFRYRGRIKADRQHELCRECFRRLRNRTRAWLLRDWA